jgi:hypothetical protein
MRESSSVSATTITPSTVATIITVRPKLAFIGHDIRDKPDSVKG